MYMSKRYRSKFEEQLAAGPLKDLPYESETILYEVYKQCHYTPDWTYLDRDGNAIYIEAKGRFQTRNGEPYKYLHIRDGLHKFEQLVFLFQQPHKPMPNAKERKDGTKITHAEWAERNGFDWYDSESIKELVNG